MHVRTRTLLTLPLALLVTACTIGASTAARSTPTTSATAVDPSRATAALPPGSVNKVLVIIEENHSLDQMRNGMPFLYSQAQRYGYATNYSAITHPSLPNYLAIAFGSTFGVRDDAAPSAHPERGPDVFTATRRAGRTARSYQESMTSSCARTNQGRYAVKHNPWAYRSTLRTYCAADDVPSGTSTTGRLHNDIVKGVLPDVGELTPNLDHDAHDGSLAAADTWLKGWLRLVYASPDWRSGHLAVVVTADEDDHNQGNKVLTTVIHPSQNGRVVTSPLSHYSLTGLLARVGHTTCIRNGCTAPSFASAFHLTVA
jgi:acid phosphatase